MRHRAFDKINPDRPRRLRAQFNEVQAIRPQLQGVLGLAIHFELQTRGPCRCRPLESRIK